MCQTFETVPFMLKHLVSRQYHIGPEGAVIGSSPKASISLPQDTALLDKHVEIKWISGILYKISGNISRIISYPVSCILLSVIFNRKESFVPIFYDGELWPNKKT